jgi:hypothetical protein
LFIVERPETPSRFACSYSCARVRSPDAPLARLRPLLAEGLSDREDEADLREDDEAEDRPLPLLADGLADLDDEDEDRLLPLLAEGLPDFDEEEDLRVEDAADLPLPEAEARDEPLPDDDEDFFAFADLVSPLSARSLFTVRAAISSARPFWPRFS